MNIQDLHNSLAYHWLHAHEDWLGISIAVIAFVESFAIVGIIVPGVVMLTIAAFIAGTGVLSLPAAMAWAFVGAVLGDGTSFLLGRYCHRYIYNIWPFTRHRRWIDQGEEFFRRYGVVSVAAGRFFGPVRPIIPLVAGALEMSPLSFYTVNVVSALGWAPLYILPGFLAGASVDYPHRIPEYLGAAAAVVVVATIAIAWARNRWFPNRTRADRHDPTDP